MATNEDIVVWPTPNGRTFPDDSGMPMAGAKWTRIQPLQTQITVENASTLEKAWEYQTGDFGRAKRHW